MSLSELEEMASGGPLIRCHNSYLVNMNQVRRLGPAEFHPAERKENPYQPEISESMPGKAGIQYQSLRSRAVSAETHLPPECQNERHSGIFPRSSSSAGSQSRGKWRPLWLSADFRFYLFSVSRQMYFGTGGQDNPAYFYADRYSALPGRRDTGCSLQGVIQHIHQQGAQVCLRDGKAVRNVDRGPEGDVCLFGPGGGVLQDSIHRQIAGETGLFCASCSRSMSASRSCMAE